MAYTSVTFTFKAVLVSTVLEALGALVVECVARCTLITDGLRAALDAIGNLDGGAVEIALGLSIISGIEHIVGEAHRADILRRTFRTQIGTLYKTAFFII